MVKIEGDEVIFCDVDETLVMWDMKENYYSQRPHPGCRLFNFVSKDFPNGIVFSLLPHVIHIELLKKYKDQKKTIVVWSAGGVDWAEFVVKELGLQEHVDLVISKPLRYVDDLNCKAWMGNRVYHKL